MPHSPTMLPDATRQRIATHAVPAVLEASQSPGDGKARFRAARHATLTDVAADAGLHPILRGGAKILLDAAEEGSHRLTDAGIDAAISGCKCAPNPDPKAVRVLKAIVDAAVEGAFLGLRSAIRL